MPQFVLISDRPLDLARALLAWARSWRIRESALRNFIELQESGEHEPPTVGNGSVDLGAWRRLAPSKEGAA